jgi:hypothetical protein
VPWLASLHSLFDGTLVVPWVLPPQYQRLRMRREARCSATAAAAAGRRAERKAGGLAGGQRQYPLAAHREARKLLLQHSAL